MRQATTDHFRAYCINRFPALQEEFCACPDKEHEKTADCPYPPAYRAFFQYLCFSTFLDEDSGELVIPHATIVRIFGTNDTAFASGVFLEQFRRDVLPAFTWRDEIPGEKCRCVVSYGWDNAFLQALDQELDVRAPKETIFVSGKAWNDRAKAIARLTAVADHEERAQTLALNPTQQKIFDYMEAVNGVQFVDKMIENAEAIQVVLGTLDPEVRKIQERILGSAKEVSKIHYYPGDRSARMSAQGDTVVGLKREVRRTLCKGWTEVDLKSSQFAILASKLDAPLSKALVASEGNLWQSFYQTTHGINEAPPPEIKRIYKEIVYGIAFGTAERTTQSTIAMNKRRSGLNLPPREPLEQKLQRLNMTSLLSHAIVRELLDLRRAWYDRITKNKGERDVWGNFIAVEPSSGTNSGRWRGAVGATAIQSIELEIISSVFDVANEHGENDDFQICLFQHDGATISFRAKAKKDRAIRKLQEAVKEKATSLGVNTSLEVENL
jgi:hypothetical protein